MLSYVLFLSHQNPEPNPLSAQRARLACVSPKNHDNNLLSFAVLVTRIRLEPRMPTVGACTQESIASHWTRKPKSRKQRKKNKRN
jgi:hypothetical protein